MSISSNPEKFNINFTIKDIENPEAKKELEALHPVLKPGNRNKEFKQLLKKGIISAELYKHIINNRYDFYEWFPDFYNINDVEDPEVKEALIPLGPYIRFPAMFNKYLKDLKDKGIISNSLYEYIDNYRSDFYNFVINPKK